MGWTILYGVAAVIPMIIYLTSGCFDMKGLPEKICGAQALFVALLFFVGFGYGAVHNLISYQKKKKSNSFESK